MIETGRLTFFSPDGNSELERTLRVTGFEVRTVSDEKDIPIGIVVLDLLSPSQVEKYLFGKQDELQKFRSEGYTVLAAVAAETLKDDHAALTIGGAHAFLLEGEGASSTRATILAAIHRRAIDDRLKKSQEQYRLLAENLGDVIWTCDIKTHRYTYVSPSVLRLRGYTVEEALGQTYEDSTTPESAQKTTRILTQALDAVERGIKPDPVTDYFERTCKDGTIKTMEITLSLIYDQAGKPTQLLGVTRDATERMRSKAAVEAALRQRELLLKELEHRVKNTLAMIASLLSLASEQVRDPADAELFEESQTRVSALALVYQKLLRSSDVASIDLGAYLEDLCRSATSSFSSGVYTIDIQVVQDAIAVDSKKAALMGLAVNELFTNSIKYATLPDRELVLKLEVRLLDGEKIQIRYQDNGPGLPSGFDVEKSGGLGFLLVLNLVSQLQGEFNIEAAGAGAGFRILVPNVD